MKKLLALLLAMIMVFALAACGGTQSAPKEEAKPAAEEAAPAEEAPAEEAPAAEEAAPAEEAPAEEADPMAALIEAAKAEGELVVYGSCEEPYLAAACQNFEKIYGIKTSFQRLSTGEVPAKIEEENGKPSADVWFGGTNNPYDDAAAKGLLDQYDAINASHLTKDMYKDPNGYWYGIYTGLLGFMVNTDELARLELEAPQTWDDLLKPEYKGLIWLSNPNTAGTAKLVINTLVQIKGHDEAMAYLVELDKNIAQYTKSGSGPSKKVGPGECTIGIGFLHDGVYQILQGYDNIGLIIPEDGTAYEVGSTAIFEGCEHPNAAKLWIEFALSPDCVELADDAGSYQFLVIDNAQMPSALAAFPELDPSKTIEYDFADAKANTSKYVEDYFNALKDAGAEADDRFKTE